MTAIINISIESSDKIYALVLILFLLFLMNFFNGVQTVGTIKVIGKIDIRVCNITYY